MSKESISYSDAIKEIEEILYKIEKEDIEIDDLSDKVKRVSFLINACKTKLLETEEQIEKIFDGNI